MAVLTDLIVSSLAPGVALTSVIFYNTSLQNRFIYITGRTRELNKEARALRHEGRARHQARLKSIEWQVTLLMRRSRIIRHAVLVTYGALISFILTILLLLTVGVLKADHLAVMPTSTFALGFILLAFSAVYSGWEMALGQSSIVEDARSSLQDPDLDELQDAAGLEKTDARP
jgi:hypothetical protein